MDQQIDNYNFFLKGVKETTRQFKSKKNVVKRMLSLKVTRILC